MSDLPPFVTLDIDVTDEVLEKIQGLAARFDLDAPTVALLALSHALDLRSFQHLLGFVSFGRALTPDERAGDLRENVRAGASSMVHKIARVDRRGRVWTACSGLFLEQDSVLTRDPVTCSNCLKKGSD